MSLRSTKSIQSKNGGVDSAEIVGLHDLWVVRDNNGALLTWSRTSGVELRILSAWLTPAFKKRTSMALNLARVWSTRFLQAVREETSVTTASTLAFKITHSTLKIPP